MQTVQGMRATWAVYAKKSVVLCFGQPKRANGRADKLAFPRIARALLPFIAPTHLTEHCLLHYQLASRCRIPVGAL